MGDGAMSRAKAKAISSLARFSSDNLAESIFDLTKASLYTINTSTL
jgi:hypothetical protein